MSSFCPERDIIFLCWTVSRPALCSGGRLCLYLLRLLTKQTSLKRESRAQAASAPHPRPFPRCAEMQDIVEKVSQLPLPLSHHPGSLGLCSTNRLTMTFLIYVFVNEHPRPCPASPREYLLHEQGTSLYHLDPSPAESSQAAETQHVHAGQYFKGETQTEQDTLRSGR